MPHIVGRATARLILRSNHAKQAIPLDMFDDDTARALVLAVSSVIDITGSDTSPAALQRGDVSVGRRRTRRR
jgi:hypothetical protein